MMQRIGFAADPSKKTENVGNCLRSALLKTRKNLILGRECYLLTSAENKYLYRDHPFRTTHWIDVDKIVYALYWPEKKDS